MSVTGPSPELGVSRALQVPAPQFGRRLLAATRPPAGRRVTYPPSIPDGRPVPARHPCIQLLLTTAEPGNDHRPTPELAASLALRRAHIGEVVKLGQGCLGGGVPVSGCLAGASDELADGGLLVLVDPDFHGLRRVRLTSSGYARHEQLRGVSQQSGLPVPDPRISTLKIPAGRRSSCPPPLPAPGGQPDPRNPDGDAGSTGTDADALDLDLSHGRQQRRTAPYSAHASLPIRSPGAHLHPQLRRPSLADRCRAGGSST
ncbi:MAG: hypothetical protein ACRDTH_17375 [Pseudonocardiaceae bacterium]